MQDFRNIQVWELSHKLVLNLYKRVNDYPGTERYRIVDQILRAAVSIPTNIAEGSSRSTDSDFARFLNYAIASASEVEYLLLLSRDLNLLSESEYVEYRENISEIRKMLSGLVRKLK